MEYRLGRSSDLKEITKVIRDAIYEMNRQGIDQWDELYPTAADFEEDIKKETLYVAMENGRIIALYVISGEADEAYDHAAWLYSKETSYVLHRFCVSPLFQNKGLGKSILLDIEEQVRSMGYESVRLDVFTGNPIAQRLYRNSGYAVRGYANWRKGRFELMEKRLSLPD